MVDAAEAGISPLEFYEMTLGEVLIAIEGHHERERKNLISRVNAVLRGLSQLGKKSTDPFKGLLTPEERNGNGGSGQFEKMAKRVFKPAEGNTLEQTNSAKELLKQARQNSFWAPEE